MSALKQELIIYSNNYFLNNYRLYVTYIANFGYDENISKCIILTRYYNVFIKFFNELEHLNNLDDLQKLKNYIDNIMKNIKEEYISKFEIKQSQLNIINFYQIKARINSIIDKHYQKTITMSNYMSNNPSHQPYIKMRAKRYNNVKKQFDSSISIESYIKHLYTDNDILEWKNKHDEYLNISLNHARNDAVTKDEFLSCARK